MALMYHNLELCTNSARYAMIMDIINNLHVHVLLYVESKVKVRLGSQVDSLVYVHDFTSVDPGSNPT